MTPSTDEDDDAGTDPAAAFAALSDTVRVDILREMVAHVRDTGEQTVGFADLRRRVGVRDSGRFRYHLNELRDHFVEKADDGYRLTPAGFEVVGAVLAGTYGERPSMGPERLDSECSLCGSRAVAVYEDGVCQVTCEADHPLFVWPIPPRAATDAALPAIVDRAELLALQAIERSLAGLCHNCYDHVEPEVRASGDERQPRFLTRCDTCGSRGVGPVTFCVLVDPRVAAFHREHDRPLREAHVWEPDFVNDPAATTVTDTDPLRVEVDVTLDGEALAVTVDDGGQVVAVQWPESAHGDGKLSDSK